MKKVLLISAVVASFLSGQIITESEALKKIMADFEKMKVEQQSSYAKYKLSIEQEFALYKKSLGRYWRDRKLSSANEWVSYSDDRKSRSTVDFKNNTLVVETLAKNKEEAEAKLKDRINYAVGSNVADVFKTDKLQKRVLEYYDKEFVEISNKPILETIVFDKKPSIKSVDVFSDKVLDRFDMTVKNTFVSNEKRYIVGIDLPKQSVYKHSQTYQDIVYKNALRFKIPSSLIFAVIHSESHYNPFAKSPASAYGLMQVVPKTAGLDVNKFLYKKTMQPSAKYLYNSKNNIGMGTAYLHMLYYKYLKDIKNPTSRLYCAIAAYNTGIGNIAWAYTNNYNIQTALPAINKMSSDEVYQYLQENLRYDEPKHYLKNVKKRIAIYDNIYT